MIRRAFVLVFATLLPALPVRADPVLPPEITIDITAIIDVVAPGEGVGYAGIGFDGTHFWLTRWNSARVTRITPAGAFVDSFDIPGLANIRSMTWDGSQFWMANNTTTLTRVDPATRTVTGTISLPANSRYASYDPVANNSQGGFWIGNFSDDIRLVDMQGNLLEILPAASVGLTGRYGIALDRFGVNPKLWVYAQEIPNNVNVGSIRLPEGTGNEQRFDLFPYLAPSTSGLAGGAFITNLLPGGRPTLLTLCQCTPNNILLGTLLVDPEIFANGFED